MSILEARKYPSINLKSLNLRVSFISHTKLIISTCRWMWNLALYLHMGYDKFIESTTALSSTNHEIEFSYKQRRFRSVQWSIGYRYRVGCWFFLLIHCPCLYIETRSISPVQRMTQRWHVDRICIKYMRKHAAILSWRFRTSSPTCKKQTHFLIMRHSSACRFNLTVNCRKLLLNNQLHNKTDYILPKIVQPFSPFTTMPQM